MIHSVHTCITAHLEQLLWDITTRPAAPTTGPAGGGEAASMRRNGTSSGAYAPATADGAAMPPPRRTRAGARVAPQPVTSAASRPDEFDGLHTLEPSLPSVPGLAEERPDTTGRLAGTGAANPAPGTAVTATDDDDDEATATSGTRSHGGDGDSLTTLELPADCPGSPGFPADSTRPQVHPPTPLREAAPPTEVFLREASGARKNTPVDGGITLRNVKDVTTWMHLRATLQVRTTRANSRIRAGHSGHCAWLVFASAYMHMHASHAVCPEQVRSRQHIWVADSALAFAALIGAALVLYLWIMTLVSARRGATPLCRIAEPHLPAPSHPPLAPRRARAHTPAFVSRHRGR